nr:argininosuccinate lyase [Pseudomonadota bacterium]
ARTVKLAIEQGVGLGDLSLATLQRFHPAMASDVHGVLTLRGSITSRTVEGGTAPIRVKGEIARHRARLKR